MTAQSPSLRVPPSDFASWPKWRRDEGFADGAADYRARKAAQAEIQQWPEPKPLPSGLLPVPGFDPAFLPARIAPWVMDISDRMQCDPAFVAVPALVALGSVLGRKLGIRPQRKIDWLEAPNLWGLVVGRPGAMKSPAATEALKPINRLEAQARKEHEENVKAFAKEEALAKIRKDEAAQAARKDIKSGRNPVLDFNEPERPKEKRFVTNDTSYEKLGEILSENPQGVMVYRDEIVSLLRTLDREDQAAARGFYLSAWSGLGPRMFSEGERKGVMMASRIAEAPKSLVVARSVSPPA